MGSQRLGFQRRRGAWLAAGNAGAKQTGHAGAPNKTGAREVYQLCVNKGKLWSVTATTAEKRWEKRKDLYGSIMASFAPKL